MSYSNQSPTVRQSRQRAAAKFRRKRRLQEGTDLTLTVAGALGGIALAALVLALPFSFLLMLAFGIGHSVFVGIPALGFVAALKVYIAVTLVKIAVVPSKSSS